MAQTEQSAAFAWTAPVVRVGYVLGKGWKITAPAGLVMRTYFPLTEETGLFRIFADLLGHEELLDFANQFGLLFGDGRDSIMDWMHRTIWLRHLIGLWDRANNDGSSLEGLVVWNNQGVAVAEPPAWQTNGPGISELYDGQPFFQIEDLDRAALLLAEAGNLGEDEYAIPARYYVGERISRALTASGAFGMTWSAPDSRHRIQLCPTNLWSAILGQFALTVDQDKRHSKCAACGRWFEVAPGLNRTDRQTCSGACRTRLYRQRKAAQ